MSGAALVTGACGFIGRHVARHLAREGWTVQGIGHGQLDAAERERWGMRAFASADVTLGSLAATGGKPALIVHCAGGSTVGSSIAHPHEDFQRTVATTAAVLEYARTRATGAHVAFLSSAAVYGDAGSAPLKEDAPTAPLSPYGVHKRIGEELCRLYGAHFDVRSVVLRFFSVYGAGMRKQLLWDASNRLRSGDASFSGSGEETRDWLHVEDAAALIARVQGFASADCPIMNGGTGVAVSVAEVLRALSAGLGRRDAPRFTGERRKGDPAALVADVSRALATGWRPQVSWQEGVRDYAAWHLQHVA